MCLKIRFPLQLLAKLLSSDQIIMEFSQVFLTKFQTQITIYLQSLDGAQLMSLLQMETVILGQLKAFE